MAATPPPSSGSSDIDRLVQALDAFGSAARAVVMQAHQEAYRYASQYVGTAHLLLALVSDVSSPITAALRARAAGPDVIRRRFEQLTKARADGAPRVVHLAYSTNAKLLLIRAASQARANASAPAPEHLWWAMSAIDHSVAGHILADVGQLGYLQHACAGACPDQP